MFLTESDRSRLGTALGASLADKIIAVVEDAASRGNVSVPEPVVPEPEPEPEVTPEPETDESVDIDSDDVIEDDEGE